MNPLIAAIASLITCALPMRRFLRLDNASTIPDWITLDELIEADARYQAWENSDAAP
jgi:hypothetical protein